MKKAAVRRIPFMQAIKSAFLNQFDFKGRSSRSEYWYFQLFGAIVSLAISIPLIISAVVFAIIMADTNPSMYDSYTSSAVAAGEVTAVSVLIYFVIFIGIISGILLIPSLSLTVRRLHDSGKSGWLYFLTFIPYAGAIVIFVFTLLGSDEGTNKYGDVVFYNRTNANQDAASQEVEAPVDNQ